MSEHDALLSLAGGCLAEELVFAAHHLVWLRREQDLRCGTAKVVGR